MAQADDLFEDSFSAGNLGWRALGNANINDWVAQDDGDTTSISINNLGVSSGNYIVPKTELSLPSQTELTVLTRIDELGSSGNVTFAVGVDADAGAITEGGTALQLAANSVKVSQPVAKRTLCSASAPIPFGSSVTVTIQRYDGLVRMLVDGEQVAVVADESDAGTSIALGAFQAVATHSYVGVRSLDAKPEEFPSSATGCGWVDPNGPDQDQPILANQSGYDLDMPKRFTAPKAADGDAFQIRDASDAVVFEGTIVANIGDFSEFTPVDEGPFHIRVIGESGESDSFEFGIGPNWTTRISYEKALRFMAESICYWGDFSQVGVGGLASNDLGPEGCRKAVAWRDASQYGHELTSLADLYLSNPSTIIQIPGDPDLFTSAPHDLPDDTPLIAQLMYWGAEVYVREEVNDPQLKGQLAAFLYLYPDFEHWLPRDTYERVRDYVFEVWDEPGHDRFVWQAYTSGYDGNLLGVYTQVGTGKGEFAPGHSIVPNLYMHDVAEREGRDAEPYLEAAVTQAEWIAEHLDVTDPQSTKGQRQSEWLTVTAMARLALSFPDAAPPALLDFVREWSEVAISRSDNMWDFRKFDDSGSDEDRWTIPDFTGSGSGADPNEVGNVAGFAAPALAAATLLGAQDPISARLEEMASAHLDNIFGRNPVGRAAQYQVEDPGLAFEGLDRGWFSEYRGGFGALEGLPGVLDGSPKDGHYPYNPDTGNIGHTEAWVNHNAAFNASLAWLGFHQTEVQLGIHSGFSRAPQAASSMTVAIEVSAPLTIERRSDVARQATVLANGEVLATVPLTPSAAEPGVYNAELSVDTDALSGAELTVQMGAGSFVVADTLVVPEAPVEVTPEAVAFVDREGTSEDEFVVPAVDGVRYLHGGEVLLAGAHAAAGTVVVVAEAMEGYVFPEGSVTEWFHTFEGAVSPSPTPDPSVEPDPSDEPSGKPDPSSVPSEEPAPSTAPTAPPVPTPGVSTPGTDAGPTRPGLPSTGN